jgi:TonB family protein
MHHTFVLAFFLSLLCLFLPAKSHATTSLNGMAAHIDLGKELFIGALYTETPSTKPETLLANSKNMRLEIKITSTDGLSLRRFERWWTDGAGNNNTAETLIAQADNIVKFTGMFKSRLIANDVINISSDSTNAVVISLNGISLGTINNASFFNTLLSTWIGRVPVSSDFKEGVLDILKVPSALITRYESIKPSEERTASIKLWGTTTAASSSVPPKEIASNSSSSSAVSLEKIKLKTSEKIAAINKNSPPPTEEDDADSNKTQLTAQTLLARQFYVSDLLKKILAHTSYPRRALDLNQSGSVRVAVVINREGNILNIALAQPSEFDLLNNAALDAVNKTAPFPPLPDSISGESFSFTAPMRFTVPK